MLIKKLSFRPKDKEALEAFVKHVFPVVGDLSEEEKKLVKKFLEDPVEGIREILEYYGVKTFEVLRKVLHKEDVPTEKKSLLRMLEEYVEKRGWTWEDDKGRKCFLWEGHINVSPFEKDGRIFPMCYRDFVNLKRIKRVLEELNRKGVEEFLESEGKIKSMLWPEIRWYEDMLEITEDLVEKALSRKKKSLTFDEALEIVNWLYERWEKFYGEAEKKGWIWEDEKGERHFIWEMDLSWVNLRGEFLPESPEDSRKLPEIKKRLEEVGQKGAGEFLRIKTTRGRIEWWYNGLEISCDLASKVLGRKVEVCEELTFGEAKKIIDWLYNYWNSLGLFEARERGWIRGGQWIWEKNIRVFFDGKRKDTFSLLCSQDVENLKRIKEYLEEIKEKGAVKFLRIGTVSLEEIAWLGDKLWIWEELARRILGNVEGREEISIGEALKIVNWLYERWKETKEDY